MAPRVRPVSTRPALRLYSEAPQLHPPAAPSFRPTPQFPGRLLQRHHPSMRQRTERPKQTALEANVLFVSELKKLKSTEDVRDAAKEFKQLVAATRLEPNLRTYHALISSLTKNRLFVEAQELSEEMLSKFRPTSVTYGVLITLAGQTNDTAKAKSFYAECLSQTDLTFQVGFFNAMLSVIEEHGPSEAVWDVVQDIGKKDLLPDSVTLSLLIRATRRRPADASKALQVLHVMKRSGWKPDPLTLNSLIRMFCRVGDLENAEVCLDDLKKLNSTPNLVTWNILILASGLHGSEKSMETKYAEMLAAGVAPTTATFNERLNILGRYQRFPQALAAYQDMLARNLEPDGLTFLALAHVYRRMGNAEKLAQVKADLESYCRRTGFRVLSGKMHSLFHTPMSKPDVPKPAEDIVKQNDPELDQLKAELRASLGAK